MQRRCVCVVAWLISMAGGFAQTATPAQPMPDHTGVVIELQESLSSETLHSGQEIAFKVVGDVMVSGRTVLAAGTPLTGEVNTVQSAGAFRRAGSFDLRLKPLRLADGSVVQLEFPRPKTRSSKGEKTATGFAAVPVLLYYFPLIPFAVAENSKKGATFKVRAGERYLVYAMLPQSTERQDNPNGEQKPAPSPE